MASNTCSIYHQPGNGQAEKTVGTGWKAVTLQKTWIASVALRSCFGGYVTYATVWVSLLRSQRPMEQISFCYMLGSELATSFKLD